MNHQSGVTLIELLIVMAIAAVLLGVGVPSFRDLIQSNRVGAVANDLMASLQFARSEAVRRGENVTLCSSDDQTTCSGGWVDGWVVGNAAGAIRSWPAARAGVTIAVAGATVFNPLGGVADARCFQVELGTFLRRVEVGAGGRIAGARGACP